MQIHYGLLIYVTANDSTHSRDTNFVNDFSGRSSHHSLVISMAENIYTKGTRVWFEDKDHAWISAEVLSATKGTDDIIKLLFIDERGKVYLLFLVYSNLISWSRFRRSPLIQQERKSRRERKVYHRFVILLYLRPPMTLQLFPI